MSPIDLFLLVSHGSQSHSPQPNAEGGSASAKQIANFARGVSAAGARVDTMRAALEIDGRRGWITEMRGKQTRLIRSATLNGFIQTAAKVGLDPNQLFAEVGLDIDSNQDPNTLISLDAYLRLLDLSASASGVSDFGVRASIARGLPDYGVASLFMRDAENVESALAAFGAYLPLHSDATSVTVDKGFGDPFIAFELSRCTSDQSFQVTQLGLVGITQTLRWLTDGAFQPKWVCLAHPRPLVSSVAERFFGCQITSNELLSGMVVSRELLRRPLETSPRFLREAGLFHLKKAFPRPKDDFSSKVARIIKDRLAESECTAESVALELRMDRRTLNRRLQPEKMTFSAILCQVRCEIVETNLANANCSLTELASITGFGSLSAFSRWFRDSFGCSATDWRRARSERD